MIQIWDDRWLPTPRAHTAQSPVRLLDRNAKVCELLDENRHGWDTELVQENFNEEEANEMQHGGMPM